MSEPKFWSDPQPHLSSKVHCCIFVVLDEEVTVQVDSNGLLANVTLVLKILYPLLLLNYQIFVVGVAKSGITSNNTSTSNSTFYRNGIDEVH